MNNIWYRIQPTEFELLPSARRPDKIKMMEEYVFAFVSQNDILHGCSMVDEFRNAVYSEFKFNGNQDYQLFLNLYYSDIFINFRYKDIEKDTLFKHQEGITNGEVFDTFAKTVHMLYTKKDTFYRSLFPSLVSTNMAFLQHANYDNGGITPTWYLDIGEDLDVLIKYFKEDYPQNIYSFDMGKYFEYSLQTAGAAVKIDFKNGNVEEQNISSFFHYQQKEFKDIKNMQDQKAGLLFFPYDEKDLLELGIISKKPV
jgi:hypothetical protein